MIQSGDGDWIINPIPIGVEFQTSRTALILDWLSVLEAEKAFDLAGTSPPNQKSFLRALCASVVKHLFWTRVKESGESNISPSLLIEKQ